MSGINEEAQDGVGVDSLDSCDRADACSFDEPLKDTQATFPAHGVHDAPVLALDGPEAVYWRLPGLAQGPGWLRWSGGRLKDKSN